MAYRIFDPATDVAAYEATFHPCDFGDCAYWFSADNRYVPSSWRTYPKSRLAALLPEGVTPEGFCFCECAVHLGGDIVYLAYCKGDNLYVLVPDTRSDEEAFESYCCVDAFVGSLDDYIPDATCITDNFATTCYWAI